VVRQEASYIQFMIGFMPPQLIARMEKLSARTGIPEASLFDAGMAVMEWMLDKKAEGYTLLLQDEEGDLFQPNLSLTMMNENGVSRLGNL
jgi:hypothetical protein